MEQQQIALPAVWPRLPSGRGEVGGMAIAGGQLCKARRPRPRWLLEDQETTSMLTSWRPGLFALCWGGCWYVTWQKRSIRRTIVCWAYCLLENLLSERWRWRLWVSHAPRHAVKYQENLIHRLLANKKQSLWKTESSYLLSTGKRSFPPSQLESLWWPQDICLPPSGVTGERGAAQRPLPALLIDLH